MNGNLKIADFGLSKTGIKPSEMAYTYCGSPEYMAPEMLSKYKSTYLDQAIIFQLTTTVWEPYFMS